MNATQGVCTESWLSQPTEPKRGLPQLFPGVDATQPGPKQHRRGLHDCRRRDTRFRSPVRDWRDDVPGEPEDLFRIGDSGDGELLWFSFLQPLPFQFRNIFNQLLHLVIIMDGLANALLPSFGDANLTQFSIPALN